jgi:hypothetical protein
MLRHFSDGIDTLFKSLIWLILLEPKVMIFLLRFKDYKHLNFINNKDSMLRILFPLSNNYFKPMKCTSWIYLIIIECPLSPILWLNFYIGRFMSCTLYHFCKYWFPIVLLIFSIINKPQVVIQDGFDILLMKGQFL